jgi:signal transduction histidine kinase
MDKNLRRLVHLVTDIFDITRIEADKVQWHFAPADLTELVGEIVEIMTPLAEEHGLRLHFVPPGPMSADIDMERIEQVIVNLTDNAIKYSPKDGLISFVVLREKGEIRVQVQDQGPGIPAEDREVIFKKFHTAPSSGRAGKPGGTGLGLAICSQIVRAHGGRIWAQDNPEGGSIFTFTLPTRKNDPRKT